MENACVRQDHRATANDEEQYRAFVITDGTFGNDLAEPSRGRVADVILYISICIAFFRAFRIIRAKVSSPFSIFTKSICIVEFFIRVKIESRSREPVRVRDDRSVESIL